MLLRAVVLLCGADMRQIKRQRAGALGYRHRIVVKYHHQRSLALSGVVQTLVRHAAGERSVADHRSYASAASL